MNAPSIAIVGAGAIGSYLAAMLVRSGVDVTVVARGAQLAALSSAGVEFHDAGRREQIALRAVGDLTQVDAELLLLTVKAHQMPPLAAELARQQQRGATLVTLHNGVPWWYLPSHPGEYQEHVLRSVDPDGQLARALTVTRTLGATTMASATSPAPGIVEHRGSHAIALGELDARDCETRDRLAALLKAAGLHVSLEPIRPALWYKLAINVSRNSVSALTRQRLGPIFADDELRAVIGLLLDETLAVAAAFGDRPSVPLAEYFQLPLGGEQVKTSMLQDVEAGRMLELDPILGAVIELGELVGVATPTIRVVYALAKGLDSRKAV